MPRSLWKGPFVDAFMSRWKQTDTKIKSRGSVILPDFVGKTVQIHNGQKFLALKITEEMIGHKFGEFSSTRKVGDKPKKGKK